MSGMDMGAGDGAMAGMAGHEGHVMPAMDMAPDSAPPPDLPHGSDHHGAGNAAVAEMPPVQEFQMAHDPRGEVEYTTQVAKFQGVYHLTIHIPEGLGAEQTEIGFVGLKGEHVQRKREAVEAVYEIRPVPKDTDHVRNTMGAAWESGHS